MARIYATDRDYVRLINTSRWRRLRAKKLNDSPLCERCNEAGILTQATEVHHRQPVDRGRDIAEKAARCYDYTNLMSLCSDCHDAIHAEIQSHAPETIAAQAKRESEAMKRVLFDGGR